MNKLKVELLNKHFGKKKVLRDVSIEFTNGVYGLIGPNGAGKTTMFRCIANLHDCDVKELTINGISIGKKEYPYMIGYLPQAFGAFKEMSVEDMLHFFADMKKLDKEIIEGEIERVLEQTNLLEERKKKIRAISGGMLRRLGIAQAILGSPKIILLDEPTVGLDPEERQRFWMVVREVGKQSIVCLSTHIIDDVRAVCDYIMIMNQGEIYVNDTAANIKKHVEGHVYLCDKEELKHVKGCYEVVRMDEKARIIASEEQDFLRAEADIEDGYICYIKELLPR